MFSNSLYVHIPWCVRKCPYCDFNSHKQPDVLPEKTYIDALIADFTDDLNHFPTQTINTLFIGGGTPSLFSPDSFEHLFQSLKQLVSFHEDIEITLEANPGTVEQQRFQAYRQLGINRLSLGIQSFHPKHLARLGRIHDGNQAHRAIEAARAAGFTNINLDLMHSLPEQSIAEGLHDLNTALSHNPEHLSWYQLTIEPNTLFYKAPPPLPSEESMCQLEEEGLALLAKDHYHRYEISAFSKPNKASRHNLNYWLFGDYYGIGAGAHGKLTATDGTVCRTQKHRQPSQYLNANPSFLTSKQTVHANDLIFEFMLNTTRLEQSIPHHLFSTQTGLPFDRLKPHLQRALDKKLIHMNETHWQITPLGRRFTNDLQALFLLD